MAHKRETSQLNEEENEMDRFRDLGRAFELVM